MMVAMRMFLLLVLSYLVKSEKSHFSRTTMLDPNSTKCFDIFVGKGQKVVGNYTTLVDQNSDALIDFMLKTPNGFLINEQVNRKSGKFRFGSLNTGNHGMCFASITSITTEMVIFHVTIEGEPKKD